MVVMVPLTTMKQDQISTMPVVAVVVLGPLDPEALVDKVVEVMELILAPIAVSRALMASVEVAVAAEMVTHLLPVMVEMVLL